MYTRKKQTLIFLILTSLILFTDNWNVTGEVQEMASTQQQTTPASHLTRSNTDFSLDLYRELGKTDQSRNLFFSPGSISVAMAMTYLGARGNTAAEMKKVLKFQDVEDGDIHQGFSELLALFQKSGSITLHMANRLFAEQSYSFVESYLQDSMKFYAAELAKVNFIGATEAARKDINDWVETKTANRIQNLIPSGVLDSLTRLVLVNAVYFKGDWKDKFDEKRTKPGDFTALDGSKVTVPMMYQKKKFSFGANQKLNAQAVELPYADNSMSLIIMLPSPGKFEEFERNLTLEDVLSCEKSFMMAPRHDVNLYLPRFRMEDSFSLGDTLSSLGMKDLFSQETSNLSGIDSTNKLYVSKVLHKAFLEVNEEGSEAAAATAVVMQMRSLPRVTEMRCDRPFFFFIRENTTRSILFMGRMMKPSAQVKDEL